jgi:uncharacterized protein with PQ loop repeat
VRKRTILWMEVISFILAIIGVVAFLPSILSVAQSCTQDQLNAGTCTPSVSAGAGAGFAIGIVLLIIAGLLATIAWIGALIRSAKMQTWGWFVVVLLLHWLGTLIYAVGGPSDQPAMAAYPPQQYPPQYPRQ